MPAPLTQTIDEAIAVAEAILPGVAAPDDEADPRWQAIIEIGHYIEDEPEKLWAFIDRWGSHEDDDLRAAIATCLLEEILSEHFDLIFPRVQVRIKDDPIFAEMFCMCWIEASPENRERFESLKRTVR